MVINTKITTKRTWLKQGLTRECVFNHPVQNNNGGRCAVKARSFTNDTLNATHSSCMIVFDQTFF